MADKLTVAKLRAACEALKRVAGMRQVSDHFYVHRNAWIKFGGDPAVFDQLPTADMTDGIHGH